MHHIKSSRPIRVAVVIPKYGLVGGAEEFAAELTERLARNPRYDIHVFANRWQETSSQIKFHKVSILSFPKFLSTPSFARFAAKWIAAEKIDLVHSHERIFHADLVTLHGVPHRFWVREIRKKRPNLYDTATIWVEQKMMADQACHWYLPVSSLTQSIFEQEYTIDSKRIRVIHPGVDTSIFEAKNRSNCRTEVRRMFGIGDDQPVMLFVSMNFEIKGLDELLRGMAALQDRGVDGAWKLLVVGKGDETKYRAIARKLGLEDMVLFAGVVPKERLVSIYYACDAFAMLSRFDTFGMVVLEAMAAGLPVLISANVGAKDLIEQGTNGFIIENPSVSNAVASYLNQLLNSDLRAQMEQSVLETARNNSWKAAVKQVEELYEDVIRSKKCDTKTSFHPCDVHKSL
ncbi:MAG: glycosyltransferase family 4 protein [Syntrophales bacterium]|jgi:UDP-glucose:(heptosyl)LPS alpha-1,3-glucosyltransferase